MGKNSFTVLADREAQKCGARADRRKTTGTQSVRSNFCKKRTLRVIAIHIAQVTVFVSNYH